MQRFANTEKMPSKWLLMTVGLQQLQYQAWTMRIGGRERLNLCVVKLRAASLHPELRPVSIVLSKSPLGALNFSDSAHSTSCREIWLHTPSSLQAPRVGPAAGGQGRKRAPSLPPWLLPENAAPPDPVAPPCAPWMPMPHLSTVRDLENASTTSQVASHQNERSSKAFHIP